MRSNKSANAAKSMSQPLAMMNNGRNPLQVKTGNPPRAVQRRKSKFLPTNIDNKTQSQNSMLPPKSNYSKPGSFRVKDTLTNSSMNESGNFKKINSMKSSKDSLDNNNLQSPSNKKAPVTLVKGPPPILNSQMNNASFPSKIDPPPAKTGATAESPGLPKKPDQPKSEPQNSNSGIIGQKEPQNPPESQSFYNVGDSSMAKNQARPPRLRVPRVGSRMRPTGHIPEEDRAPTIPEDDNESAISSMQANPRDYTTRSFGNPSIIRPKSQASYEVANSPTAFTPNMTNSLIEDNAMNSLRNVDKNKFNKQKTPSTMAYKMLDDSGKVLSPKDAEKRLDISINEKSNAQTPKADSKIEEIPEEIPKEEEGGKEITPRVEERPKQGNLIYFKSKDPDPKTITPMGGKGPTLTKTIVKPVIAGAKEEQKKPQKSQNNDLELMDLSLEKDPPAPIPEEIPKSDPVEKFENLPIAIKIPPDKKEDLEEEKEPVEANKPEEADKIKEDPPEPDNPKGSEPIPKSGENPSLKDAELTEEQKLEAEAEELRKLEEEVAKLEQETGDDPQETTTYSEQTVIVDGKRKRKKRKKKRRKKIGGGEETIANITVEEVDLDDMEAPDGTPLNPMVKKKGKKKKAPNTKLNTVVEDSKEHSSLMEHQRMDTFKFSEDEKEDQKIEDRIDDKGENNPEDDTKQDDSYDFSSPKNQEDSKKKESKLSKFSHAENNPNQNDISNDYDGDQFEEDEKTPKIDTKKEVKEEENENLPPVLKPSSGLNTNKFAEAIELKEEPKESPKLEMIRPPAPVALISQNEVYKNIQASPDKTEIDTNTNIDPPVDSKFTQSNPFGKVGSLKKTKTVVEQKENKVPSIADEKDLAKAQGAISLLPLNCEIHREEYIQYFCREDDCKFGLCQECLYSHENHDFIYADEIASFEIKQSLKATMTECAYKIKSQQMLYNETKKLSQYLEDLKKQEYEKMHYYFEGLKKELEKREKALKEQFHEKVKDVEAILDRDVLILEKRMQEFNSINDKLKEKAARFRLSNDLAIVANAYEVFDLRRKVKNNNFEGKRLELEEDEEGAEESKIQESLDQYDFNPKKRHVNKDEEKKFKEQMLNDGEHVFFVQLDSELPMPQFAINITKEKKKIESIGTIKNNLIPSQGQQDAPLDSERSKMHSEPDIASQFNHQQENKMSRNKNYDNVREFMDNYQDYSNSFYSKQSPNKNLIAQKKFAMSYNEKISERHDETLPPRPITSQRDVITEEKFPLSDLNMGREMYWFKWDSYDCWKYNFNDDIWSLIEDVKPSQKFLYFSNIVHLKDNSG